MKGGCTKRYRKFAWRWDPMSVKITGGARMARQYESENAECAEGGSVLRVVVG